MGSILTSISNYFKSQPCLTSDDYIHSTLLSRNNKWQPYNDDNNNTTYADYDAAVQSYHEYVYNRSEPQRPSLEIIHEHQLR